MCLTALRVARYTKKTSRTGSESRRRRREVAKILSWVDTSHIVQKADGTLVCMIQSGDTLKGISATLGYSVNEFANVNYIYANSALRVPKGN